MKIISIEDEPALSIPFLNASSGKAGGLMVDQLPVHFGVVDRLPHDVDLLLVTADLQGREDFQFQQGPSLRLLGEWLPNYFKVRVLPDLGLGNARVGAVLAGDFYTVPAANKRGGTGDVTSVWKAFSDEFEWVVGVAGNHDLFGENVNERPRSRRCEFFLDGDVSEIGGIRFGGISGIVGENVQKNWRKTERQFKSLIEELDSQEVEVLVLHDGPTDSKEQLKGSIAIRDAIRHSSIQLVIRGHAHWKPLLVQLDAGQQVLNVEARVVLLTARD